jgi:type I site-specific restriction-modification system R (restriction) subunit
VEDAGVSDRQMQQCPFKVFGTEDAEGYLDKYSIAESIEDGTTLPLHYSLAPNEMRVPREQLEKEFLTWPRLKASATSRT